MPPKQNKKSEDDRLKTVAERETAVKARGENHAKRMMSLRAKIYPTWNDDVAKMYQKYVEEGAHSLDYTQLMLLYPAATRPGESYANDLDLLIKRIDEWKSGWANKQELFELAKFQTELLVNTCENFKKDAVKEAKDDYQPQIDQLKAENKQLRANMKKLELQNRKSSYIAREIVVSGKDWSTHEGENPRRITKNNPELFKAIAAYIGEFYKSAEFKTEFIESVQRLQKAEGETLRYAILLVSVDIQQQIVHFAQKDEVARNHIRAGQSKDQREYIRVRRPYRKAVAQFNKESQEGKINIFALLSSDPVSGQPLILKLSGSDPRVKHLKALADEGKLKGPSEWNEEWRSLIE